MEKAFHVGVIVAISLPGHGLGNTQKTKLSPNHFRAKLDTLVGMEYQQVQFTGCISHGIYQSIFSIHCFHGWTQAPSLDFPIKYIHNHHQINKSFHFRGNIRQIRYPYLVGPVILWDSILKYPGGLKDCLLWF